MNLNYKFQSDVIVCYTESLVSEIWPKHYKTCVDHKEEEWIEK